MALAVITIASIAGAAAWGYTKLVSKLSSGFTKIEHGQAELKDDFSELKTEMRETKSELNEMKIDIAWTQASTGTPPRKSS